MNELYRNKQYFAGLLYLFAFFFTIIFIIGDIFYIVYGFAVGFPNRDVVIILSMFLVSFQVCNVGMLLCLEYWYYEDDGIINGIQLHKKKILFSDVDKAEIRYIRLVKSSEKCLCLYKGKKRVLIPTWFLRDGGFEWIKERINVEIVDKSNEPPKTKLW